jgi:hypothetical protein
MRVARVVQELCKLVGDVVLHSWGATLRLVIILVTLAVLAVSLGIVPR